MSQLYTELITTPGWIFRTGFWRYYLVSGLTPYKESNTATWYHNQPMHMPVPWRKLFDSVLDLAGPKFRLMRYALTGQTQSQHQTLHGDVSADLPGQYRSYLLYLNTEWNCAWGGQTDFVHENAIVHQEWPEPGKLVEFDSKVLHQGQPPTQPNMLRLSMVLHGQLD